MDADSIAARTTERAELLPPPPLDCFPSLNFQPSTINVGDQSEVSNSASLDLADRP